MAERSMNNIDIKLFFTELLKHKKVYLKINGMLFRATPHDIGIKMQCITDNTSFTCSALDIFTQSWEPEVLKGDAVELLYNTE